MLSVKRVIFEDYCVSHILLLCFCWCDFVLLCYFFFYSDSDYNTMLTAVSLFLTFLSIVSVVCLFCSQIVVNTMELDATVIQVKGLASFQARLNPSLST